MNPFDRNTNLLIINELRNSEKISLDEYIEKVLVPLKEESSTFLESLYKDITYVLDGVDQEGDNDLMIKDGDLVIENGDLKLTGYQSRLHDIVLWIHIEIMDKLISEIKPSMNIMEDFIEKGERFETEFLTNYNYTPEYKKELDKIKSSLKNERKQNHDNKKPGLRKFLDPDILHLKPNVFGVGLNLNELINRLRNK